MKSYTITLTSEQWSLIDGALNTLGEQDREYIEFMELDGEDNEESISNMESEISDIDEIQISIMNQMKEQRV